MDQPRLTIEKMNELTKPIQSKADAPIEVSYETFVASRCKEGATIAKEMDGASAHLVHMAMGISGEAGELLDAIKKHAIYQKPLDVANVKEELGDLMFYMTGLASALGFTLKECATLNAEKLTKRYPVAYSDLDAQARKDKQT